MERLFAVCRILFAVSCGALLTARGAQAGQVVVTNTNNSAAGSLRQAILDANAGDVIVFGIPTSDSGYDSVTHAYTVTLTTAELLVGSSLTIDGGGQKITVKRSNASPKFRIFHLLGGNVTISGLAIALGSAGTPGPDSPSGGGILNAGSNLVVNNCTFADNDGYQSGGGIYNASGTLLVNGCTFRKNSAFNGGGLVSSAPATVNNSTFAANSSVDGGRGGGIYNDGPLTVTNCTIVDNSTTAAGGGIASDAAGTIHVRNTIIAGNSAPQTYDVVGAFISDGYNLIGILGNFATGFGSSGSHDQVGTTASPLNPGLGPLQDNSGPTLTFAPSSPSSPVIDRGNRGTDSNGQPIDTDQRGSPRPIDLPGSANGGGSDGSDIGAVETGPAQPGPTFTVTNTADRADGACTVDNCTLRDALNLSNATQNAHVINFADGVTGIINGSGGGLTINNPLTINGPGARLLSISGRNSDQVFLVATNAVISGLTIRSGNSGSAFFDGGGIYNGGGGSLTLRDCVVTLCKSNDLLGGGGIFNEGGATLVLTRCTLVQNFTNRAGGAVYNLGTFTATNCTFVDNEALNGGAIISKANNGMSSTTLRNCTITHNFADDVNQGGGGVYAEGSNTQFHLGNTIIAPNFSGGSNPDIRGNVTSDGFNFVGKIGSADGLTNGMNGDQVGSNPGIDPNLSALLRDNGGQTDTVGLFSPSSAINAGNDALAPATDQRGYLRSGVSDIGAFEFGGALPTPTPSPTPTATPTATPGATPPGLVSNVSTRLPVGTGDNVLIEGFIVQGPGGSTKKIIVRAIGPSLVPFGISDALANPTLEIRDGSNALIASNNDWGTTQVGGIIAGDQAAQISASGLAPGNDAESAIIADLAPGSYTAVVRGVGDSFGTGVVDAYDLSAASPARLANIATRGLIQPGDKLMIAGFIVQNGPVRAVILAVGPSLSAFGISNALPDTTLQLRDQNGVIVREDDDWQSDQKAELEATGLQPSDLREAAMVVNIPPGQYTAQVRGKPEQTGIGVVQVFFLQ
jgi:hypothetical protein